MLADATGSYQTGFTLLAILAGLGSSFSILATRPRPPAYDAQVSTPFRTELAESDE